MVGILFATMKGFQQEEIEMFEKHYRDLAIEIEAELANSDLNYSQIAAKYGVDEQFVRDIDRDNSENDSYSHDEDKDYDYLYDEHRMDYDPSDW
jgi:hypothetical protein